MTLTWHHILEECQVIYSWVCKDNNFRSIASQLDTKNMNFQVEVILAYLTNCKARKVYNFPKLNKIPVNTEDISLQLVYVSCQKDDLDTASKLFFVWYVFNICKLCRTSVANYTSFYCDSELERHVSG